MARISAFEMFRVPPCWLFLRLETSDGLVGWGECTLEGRNRTVKTDVERILDQYLLGEDPTAINKHWRHLTANYHNHRGPILSSAMGGIDQALWDIRGKRQGAPVYELLGGPSRDRVELYQHMNVRSRDNDHVEAFLEKIVERGFRTIKTSAAGLMSRELEARSVVDSVDELLESIRAVVPDEMRIGVDFQGRCSSSSWRDFAAVLSAHDAAFMEEPVRPEYLQDIDADSVDVPVAAGERVYRPEAFRRLFETGSIDLAQPDPVRTGGITGCRTVAQAAETFDVSLIPNCSAGPIAMAACYNLNRAVPNALMMPYVIEDSEHGLTYLDNDGDFEAEDGYFEADLGPGLGVSILEDTVEELSQRAIDWQPYGRRRDDGTPIA
jgi:galactonate dehydratase